MKINKILCRIICYALCFTMLIQLAPSQVRANSATTEIVAYLEDVKLIYAKNKDDAKKKVPEGYKLYENNINDGTGELGVYICYSTTTDPEKAITDMRVMNEDSGFDRGTFNDKMDQALEALEAQAEGIYKAITEEFAVNYASKTPGAIYAHDQLNVFMFDDDTPLGDYFVSGKLTVQDVSKMLLVCHNLVISSVLSLVAQGLQRPDGKDWLDELSKMDPEAYALDINKQREYKDLINQIQPALNNFSDQYNIMVYTDDVRASMTAEQVEMYTEDLNDETTKQWWYSLYDILNSYPLAGGTGLNAESVLVEINLGESVANHKVCMLIDSFTPGQRALVSLIGPINMIFNDLFTEEKRLEAEEELAKLKEDQGTISLWDGVDMDIFSTEVGITSPAYEEMITADNYDIFTNENYVLKKTVEDYISIITNYSTLVSGSFMVLSAVTMLAKASASKFVLCKALATVGTFLTKGLIGTIFLYTPYVVFAVCLLATLIIWIVKEIQAGKPPSHDRTTIPKYMIDSATDSAGAQRYEIYKRVDNVQTDSELKKTSGYELGGVDNLCGADINACKGYYWSAIYVSRSQSTGNPIVAEFEISKSLNKISEGFMPLRHFNKKSEGANLNAVDEYNSSDVPLYLNYKSEWLAENHTVYKYIRNLSVVSVSLTEPTNPDKFRFTTNEAINVAKKELDELGMYVVDYNFSNDKNVVSMIGWSGTDNADNAVKDIRFVYKSSIGRTGSGYFGSSAYGNIGIINDWSVFISRGEQNPAPPITMLRLVKKDANPETEEGFSLSVNAKDSSFVGDDKSNTIKGWEPANEFSGGPAVPLGKEYAQLYFLPETTFTTGVDYLAGIEVDAYIYNYSFDHDADGCNHLDIWANDYENYKKYKIENHGESFYDDVVMTLQDEMSSSVSYEQAHNYSKNNPNCEYTNKNGYTSKDRITPRSVSSVKYFTTKNPYRAIYGLASRSSEGTQLRDSFIKYSGYGYVISPVEATFSVANFELAEFGHYDLINREEKTEFINKTQILEDNEYHSKGIVVNLDVTQIMPEENHELSFNNIYMTGFTQNRTPLKVSDVKFSENMLSEGEYPENFIPFPYMGGDGSEYSNLAPVNERIICHQWFYSSRIYCAMYKPFYGYVRSEIKENDLTTSYMPGTGKYISNIYLASKENIRVSMLSSNKDVECEDISYAQLETQLVNMGATTTFDVGIGTDYYSGGDDNANTVFIGYSRTDDKDLAITDIRFHVCEPGQKPEKTIDATVNYNGKDHTVRYTLVDEISITSKANLDCVKEKNGKGAEVWSEKELYKERQAYLYVTNNTTAFPDPISEIDINVWCTNAQNEPLVNFKGETIYTVKKQSDVNLHVKDKWFEEGTTLSFRRSENKAQYVSEINIESGDNKLGIISSLVEKGYSVVNMDLNKKTAGDHIYIGVKYTEDESRAITNLLTLHQKKKHETYSVTDEKHIYELCEDIDLNKDAGGDYIYLYYTKDPRAGNPILEIYGTDSVKNQSDALYKHSTVRRLWDFEYANLNAGTTFFTSDVYLVCKQKSNTGKYISDVCVEYGWSRSGAIDKLRKKGYYEYVDKDLNDGTGSSQYIYLGYKRTDDPEKAIRNLMVFTYGDAENDMEYDGIVYKPASDVNLNRHCSAISADLFLYYTKDPKAGAPITALYCSEKPVNNKMTELGIHRTTKSQGYGTFDDGYIDLNRWALGDYIYLVMVHQPSAYFVSSMFGNGSWVVISIFIILFIICIIGAIVIHRKKVKFNFLKSRLKQ